MARRKNKTDSIYLKLLRLLILAAVAAAAAFFLLDMAGAGILDSYFSRPGYIKKQDEKYMESLKEYITENQVRALDTQELTKWVKKHSVVSIQVYRNGLLLYDSNYPEEQAIQDTTPERDFYDWETHETLRFADGSAVVVLYGMYGFQAYWYATIAELFISFFLFLGIVMLGIRKSMRYIRTLSREIGILEGGDLDYPITIQGRDELALLAESLNQMRQSFKAQIEQDAYLTEASRKMITEMSHDLRTPLTTMLIYTELLKSRKYTDEDQLWEYIDRIDRKAHQMKQLADNIFAYSLVSSGEEIRLEEPATLKELFYDVLSEAAIFLGQNGFRSCLECEWGSGKIRVNSGYVARIMDNILSNIVKYADPSSPVEITVRSEGDWEQICFINKKAERTSEGESSGIGLRSVRGMMKKMGGQSEAREEGELFLVSLKFHYCGN